jgi:hypothetical protein
LSKKTDDRVPARAASDHSGRSEDRRDLMPTWSAPVLIQASRWIRPERRAVDSFLMVSLPHRKLRSVVRSAARDHLRIYDTPEVIAGWGTWSVPRKQLVHLEQSPDGLIRLRSWSYSFRTEWFDPAQLLYAINAAARGALVIGSKSFHDRATFMKRIMRIDDDVRRRWSRATGLELRERDPL